MANLPDGRKEDAPESYNARPVSKTLTEGRYRRPPPVRTGGATEDQLRGDDFEVVEGGMPDIGTIVTLLVGGLVLGGAYVTVQLLTSTPIEKKGARMPDRDGPAPVVNFAPTSAPVEEVEAAPAVEVEP